MNHDLSKTHMTCDVPGLCCLVLILRWGSSNGQEKIGLTCFLERFCFPCKGTGVVKLVILHRPHPAIFLLTLNIDVTSGVSESSCHFGVEKPASF